MSEKFSFEESEPGPESREPRRVFVEVGTDVHPVTVAGNKEFAPNDIFIGVDADFALVKGAKEGHADISGQGHSLFLQADAKELPLQNESADQIYFGNFFGSPRVFDHPRFLKEAYRALRADGQLIIAENNTPVEYQDLKRALAEAGFKVEKYLDPYDREWDNEMNQYRREYFSPNSFLVYARKNETRNS